MFINSTVDALYIYITYIHNVCYIFKDKTHPKHVNQKKKLLFIFGQGEFVHNGKFTF